MKSLNKELLVSVKHNLYVKSKPFYQLPQPCSVTRLELQTVWGPFYGFTLFLTLDAVSYLRVTRD